MGIPEIIIKINKSNISACNPCAICNNTTMTVVLLLDTKIREKNENRNGKLLCGTQLHWGNIDYIYPSTFTQKKLRVVFMYNKNDSNIQNACYTSDTEFRKYWCGFNISWRKALKFIHLIKFDKKWGDLRCPLDSWWVKTHML